MALRSIPLADFSNDFVMADRGDAHRPSHCGCGFVKCYAWTGLKATGIAFGSRGEESGSADILGRALHKIYLGATSFEIMVEENTARRGRVARPASGCPRPAQGSFSGDSWR